MMLRWPLLGLFCLTFIVGMACSGSSSTPAADEGSSAITRAPTNASESPAGPVARLAMQALINHYDALYVTELTPDCPAPCFAGTWDLGGCVIGDVQVPSDLDREPVSVNFAAPCGTNSAAPGSHTTNCSFTMLVLNGTARLSSAPECGS